LETSAGATTTANATEAGYWKRIALALEALTSSTSTANDNVPGWMKRAAVAAEASAGTSGAEENTTDTGVLKRLVDALEVKSGAVLAGSLWYRLRMAAANAVWAPASALPAMKDYTATLAVYDPSDLTTMWQDRAGTTTQAAIGQPVGKMRNVKTSATALHMTAMTGDSLRPTLTANGLVFDGVNDGMNDGATSGLPASTTILMLVKTTDTDAIIVSNTTAAFVGCWDGTGGAISSGAGTPTVKVDGVSKTTRLALKTAINDNATHTVLIEAANLSAWGTMGFGSYAGGSFYFGGTMVPVAILNAGAGDYAAALVSAQEWATELRATLGL
jgi:hypothetical protein